jgi:hypothetical protein
MEESQKCLQCKHGLTKLEILVPENCKIKDYIHKTKDFVSNIKAITKEKPMHYSLKSLSGGSMKFRIQCICTLGKEKITCLDFKRNKEKQTRIEQLLYKKLSTCEKEEIDLLVG